MFVFGGFGVLVLRWQAVGVCLVAELLPCNCEVSDGCRVSALSLVHPPPAVWLE